MGGRCGARDTFTIARVPCYHVIVIISFRDGGTEDVFNGRDTRDARRSCPADVRSVAETSMVRVPTDREPTHPGEMLLQEFLLPLGMTQRDLATTVHVHFQRVNEVVRGKRGVTPSTALWLSKFLGTSPDFWMSLQLRWDLYHAQRAEGEQIESIRPHQPVSTT